MQWEDRPGISTQYQNSPLEVKNKKLYCHQPKKEVEFRPLTSQRRNVLHIKLGGNEVMSREKN